MRKTKFGILGKSGKVTTTHEMDLGKVKSSDPLAYAFGLVQGERGEKLQKGRGLASEYIRGWKDGHARYSKKLKKVL